MKYLLTLFLLISVAYWQKKDCIQLAGSGGSSHVCLFDSNGILIYIDSLPIHSYLSIDSITKEHLSEKYPKCRMFYSPGDENIDQIRFKKIYDSLCSLPMDIGVMPVTYFPDSTFTADTTNQYESWPGSAWIKGNDCAKSFHHKKKSINKTNK